MPTRQVHTVRIISPDDPNPDSPSMYFDVEVADAIGFSAPNGQGIYLDMTQPDPQVIDDTGDGSGRSTGSPTRISHMERLTNPSDPTQFFDAEILDGFSFVGPNGQGTTYNIPNTDTYQDGDPDSSGPFTRTGTVTTFTNPSDPTQTLNVLSTDEISANGPISDDPPARYGQIDLHFDDGDSVDPTGSAANPQPNTDPNPYLKLLPGGGPWLGPDVVVKQGPLWKIKDVIWNNIQNFFILVIETFLDDPHVPILTLNFNGDHFEIANGTAPIEATIGTAPVTLPVSDDMIANNTLWSYTEPGKNIIVFNLSKLSNPDNVINMSLTWSWTPQEGDDINSIDEQPVVLWSGLVATKTDLKTASSISDLAVLPAQEPTDLQFAGPGAASDNWPDTPYVSIADALIGDAENIAVDLKTFALSDTGDTATPTGSGGGG